MPGPGWTSVRRKLKAAIETCRPVWGSQIGPELASWLDGSDGHTLAEAEAEAVAVAVADADADAQSRCHALLFPEQSLCVRAPNRVTLDLLKLDW